MKFRSRLVTAQVQAACRPFFCKNKIGNSWLTNAAFHGILIDVDGALAQLVAHNTGSVGVRSSNLLCSTIPKKSEHHPGWGWVRISSFYLKYCGVKHTKGLSEHLRRLFGASPIENLWAKIRSFFLKYQVCQLDSSLFSDTKSSDNGEERFIRRHCLEILD